MTDSGQSRRAEIDTATVRALLLMHGGGSVALLTFLSSVLSEEGLRPLILWVLIGILYFHVGMVAGRAGHLQEE